MSGVYIPFIYRDFIPFIYRDFTYVNIFSGLLSGAVSRCTHVPWCGHNRLTNCIEAPLWCL